MSDGVRSGTDLAAIKADLALANGYASGNQAILRAELATDRVRLIHAPALVAEVELLVAALERIEVAWRALGDGSLPHYVAEREMDEAVRAKVFDT